jgi:hypothetical protein
VHDGNERLKAEHERKKAMTRVVKKIVQREDGLISELSLEGEWHRLSRAKIKKLNLGPGNWGELTTIQPKKVAAQRVKGAKKLPPLAP